MKCMTNIMKKLMCLLMVLVLFACSNGWDASSLTLVETKDVPEGISVELVKLDENEICITYHNETEEQWHYGENYSLQVFLDEEWYYVPLKKSEATQDIAFILEAKETKEERYSLSKFKKLKAGLYRFENNGAYVEFEINE